MAHYEIVEWAQYQQYKDRDPPWIKLHRETMTSRTWVRSDDRARVLAIACMLLAAGTANKIPADPDYVRRRAYLSYEPDFAPLVDVGFIRLIKETNDLAEDSQAVAGTTLAGRTECYSEGEAEKSRAEKKDNSTAAKPGADAKRGSRLTDDFQLTPELRAFASDLGLEPNGLRDEFVDFWTSVPGSRGLKLDWSKTFKNRCRELGKRPRSNADAREAEIDAAIKRGLAS